MKLMYRIQIQKREIKGIFEKILKVSLKRGDEYGTET
jgi:hypothetical protein